MRPVASATLNESGMTLRWIATAVWRRMVAGDRIELPTRGFSIPHAVLTKSKNGDPTRPRCCRVQSRA